MLLAGLLAAGACRRAPEPPLVPQTSGTLTVAGLIAPVRVVRDRWGVPHVFAESRADLFLAQGVIQAQDRLFQMDLWRRSNHGRLAEVLGANFIDRDAMTRRLQYHGDLDAEWASYGADAKTMAESFVRGINAWVERARARPPELFVLAGWKPEPWTASDLLDRVDAFDRDATIAKVASGGFPAAVVEAVRRAAAPPFFTGLAARIAAAPAAPDRPGDWRPLPSPSPQYLVHLHGPDVNVAGATMPWRPGVAVGHDPAGSWDRTPALVSADILVEPMDAGRRVVRDAITVKGRAEPFEYETRFTDRGVVIATDRTAGRLFTLGWPGLEKGTAPAFATSGRVGAAGRIDRGGGASVVFRHPLAITDAARVRFDIGPLSPPAGDDRPFRIEWNASNAAAWDESKAINAPGQSEWRGSPHYGDHAQLWSAGEMARLVYSEAAVTANAESTLTLVPDRRR